MDPRRGFVALGDSITRGRGGAPVLGVHPQSWALWLAEALELPYTGLAVDGAQAPDVLREQVPRLSGRYDLAALSVGANDARSVDFDVEVFEDAVGRILEALAGFADRLLVLTVPLDLGRPPAGPKVPLANAALIRHAERRGATVCRLDDLSGPPHVLPDAVHPTSVGMVEIADRAARALGATARPSALSHATARRDPVSRGRFAAWYAKQVVRDHRRRLVERRRYRHLLR